MKKKEATLRCYQLSGFYKHIYDQKDGLASGVKPIPTAITA